MQRWDPRSLSLDKDKACINDSLKMALEYIDRSFIATLDKAGSRVICPVVGNIAGIRGCRIRKITIGDEDIHTRLMSLYHTIGSVADACFLLIDSTGTDEGIKFYIGLRSENFSQLSEDSLKASLQGSFPGVEFEVCNDECRYQLSGMKTGNHTPTIAAITRVPSRRKMQGQEQDSLSVQSIEHFIDAMKGKKYKALILACPLSGAATQVRRVALEKLVSSLSPMEEIQYQYSRNTTLSRQHSINYSISQTITESVAHGYNESFTTSNGVNQGVSHNANIGYQNGLLFDSLGFGYGTQRGSFSSSGMTTGSSTTWTDSIADGVTRGNADTDGVSLGMSNGWSLKYANKTIQDLIEEAQRQIDRIRYFESYGCWDTCAFFISDEPAVARTAAASYHSLICGDDSGRSGSGISVWCGADANQAASARLVLDSIVSLKMPSFILPNNQNCTIGTMIGGNELPIIMNIPRKSVCGLPVNTVAAFGREVNFIDAGNSSGGGIKIGNAFHMGIEEKTSISINPERFTEHSLVCGATGVGKSTLVAMLVKATLKYAQACKRSAHFMIIEPVKGEYKYLMGNDVDYQVFTLNPLVCRLLKLNPFIFREGIHILSHIDRLIDVFNVCWPLYAAQPALLRECIEEAYIRCGWDLVNSVYVRPGMKIYPTFKDVLKIIPVIIQKSHFVGESKGTYEGALLTRVAMLTNGVYGQVFNGAGSLTDEELFEKNVVIDLSSAGSAETIGLIMGMLIIRLREYRMSTGKADNSPLKHILVLEEAHNILKQETGKNVEGGQSASGKSVEMLSSSIAEMRSYGQGFIIADQSPALLDKAAIRNTSTKFIMRLAEMEDKETVAQALSLSQQQRDYLSSFPRRTALIFQSGWIEPVLTKINNSSLRPRSTVDEESYDNIKRVRSACVKLILGMLDQRPFYFNSSVIENAIISSVLTNSKKCDILSIVKYYSQLYNTSPSVKTNRGKEVFFASLCLEIMSCNDLFRLCPPPNEKDCDDEKLEKWLSEAEYLLDQYAVGLGRLEKMLFIKTVMRLDLDSPAYKVSRKTEIYLRQNNLL